jgi:hypothetical protein
MNMTIKSHGIKTILHLCCGPLASDTIPYQEAGYNVIRVDEKMDIRTFTPPDNVYGIIANPPCTMFSFARTTAKTPRDLRQGMELVKECLRVIWECQYRIISDHQKYAPLKFWVIENPDAMLRWFLGEPRLIYTPYEYGEQYQKRTCLWGQFNIPVKNTVELTPENKDQPLPKFDHLKSKEIHPEYFGKLSRSDRRSLCSQKFARAFFEVNQ